MQTATKSTTYTQLAIAVLVLVGVSALAFGVLPMLNNDNLNQTQACTTTLGDLDRNLVLDANDVTALNNIIRGISPINLCGDMDHDGVISPIDVTILKSAIAIPQPKTCAKLGDLNNNNLYDEDDILLLSNIMRGISPFDACADMNNDAFIGPDDLTLLKTAKFKQDVPACADSDYGVNYFVAGTISLKGVIDSKDQCSIINENGGYAFSASGPFLAEHSCNGDIREKTVYKCPGGCINGACKPLLNDTKIFTCRPKPILGTEWNTVSEYKQTWNGSSWVPAGTTTQYSKAISTKACKFKCASGYSYDIYAKQCVKAEPKLSGNAIYGDPENGLVLEGAIDAVISKYTFTAENEPILIRDLQIRLASPALNEDILVVKISYQDKAGQTVTKSGAPIHGITTFRQIDMQIPAGKSNLLTISADINKIGYGATPGDLIKLCLDTGNIECLGSENLINFSAISQYSNKEFTTVENINNDDLSSQVLRSTKVTAVPSSTGGQSVIGPNSIIASFKFFSVGQNTSTLKYANFNLGGNFIGKGVGDNIIEVKAYKGSITDANLMGKTKVSNIDAGITNDILIELASNNVFTGSFEMLIVVDTTDSDFINTPNSDILATTLTKYLWNDGAETDAYPMPQNKIPANPSIF